MKRSLPLLLSVVMLAAPAASAHASSTHTQAISATALTAAGPSTSTDPALLRRVSSPVSPSAPASSPAPTGRPTQRQSILGGSILRKAASWTLRHATSQLPSKIRPYARTIADVLDDVDSWQRHTIVLALTRAGIPLDVAHATADWLILVVGV